jgi:pseudaminic acid biosynthesis-associated methylase
MNPYTTEQEKFWAGEFGDNYVARNKGEQLLATKLALFSRMLARTDNVGSIIEFGASIGLNLRAMQQLLPSAQFAGVEINDKAVAELSKIPSIAVHHQSIYTFHPKMPYSLVLTMGVLIHLNPDKLPEVYRLLYAASDRYICLAEYYSSTPVAIPYRGYEERLFKRDFAGELLAQFPDLKLCDYGFAYHGDPNFPQDDITWFLLEKTGSRR